MPTNYPGTLDSLTNPSPTDSRSSPSHAGQHTDANDAIEAIQSTLGTDPQGSEATVKARLEAIEAAPGLTHSYIGYNTIGGTTEANVNFRTIVKPVTLASDGFLASIGIYIKQTTAGASLGLGVGVWTNDGSNAPQYLRAANTTGATLNTVPYLFLQEAAGTAGAPRWIDVPLGTFLAAGNYWIGVLVHASSSAYQLYKDGSGTDRHWTHSNAALSDEGTIAAVTTTTDRYSIRASVLT